MEVMLGRPVLRHSPAHLGTAKARAKVGRVMDEYATGTLRSSSGQKVTSRAQAVAIALSEAERARKGR